MTTKTKWLVLWCYVQTYTGSIYMQVHWLNIIEILPFSSSTYSKGRVLASSSTRSISAPTWPATLMCSIRPHLCDPLSIYKGKGESFRRIKFEFGSARFCIHMIKRGYIISVIVRFCLWSPATNCCIFDNMTIWNIYNCCMTS